MKRSDDIGERFWSKVNKTDTCWLWLAYTDGLGYGRFNSPVENKSHRQSYRMEIGPIPAGMVVMHSCDVRNCVNPAHLSVGTQADNVRDMAAKGRGRGGDVRGIKNPCAKLTPAKVAIIRDLANAGVVQRRLAEQFNVSPMTISRVVRMETWA